MHRDPELGGSGASLPAGGPGTQALSRDELTPSRIDAMIRLLADDDPRIRRVMRQHLLDVLDLAEPYLVGRSDDESDPEVRNASRELLGDVRRRRRLAEWETWARRGYPDAYDLEEGVLLIDAVEHPHIDMAVSRKELDDYGHVLERRLGPPRPQGREPEGVVKRLNHLLFRERGLQGNRENYYEPENSYVHCILERKLGIPISLSVVAKLVAKRVGVDLDGIGLPGHFLLRYRSRRGREVYFDPFHGGRIWTLENCLQFVRSQGYDARDEFFRALTSREILIRWLSNLMHVYEQRDDDERRTRTTRMIEALR